MENEKNSSEGNLNSYDFVYKYITMLSNEIKERKEEIEMLKSQIKQQKKEYNQGLQHYLSLNSKLITTENELEKIYNKKSKIQKEFIIQLFSINKDILKKLKDPTNIPNNNICKLVLFFLGYNYSTDYALIQKVNKSLDDWKELIKLGIKRKFNKAEKNTLIRYLKDINSTVIHPYDILIKIIELKVSELDLDEKVNTLDNTIAQIRDNKNKIFIFLKNIEILILQNHSIYQGMIKYIKGIYSLFEKFNRYKQIDNSKENTELKDKLFIDLLKSIKEFKQHKFKENIFNTDTTSLTIRSDFSDEISSLSITTDKFQLTNNNNISNTKDSYKPPPTQTPQKSKQNYPSANFYSHKNLSKPISSKSATKPSKISSMKKEINDEMENLYSEESQDIITNNDNQILFTKLDFTNNERSSIYTNTNTTFDIQEYNKGNINYISPLNTLSIKPSKFSEKSSSVKSEKNKRVNTIIYEKNVNIDKCCTACT